MMNKIKTVVVVYFFQFLHLCHSAKVPLVVLGVDGYGYSLYEKFGDQSLESSYVIPLKTVFPSKTFPNFMSIATGLYPTQHGLISNKFLNKKENEYFIYEDEQHQDFDWFKGEPIWITAKKRGLRVYVDMWVGSTAKYNGLRPDFYSRYNSSKTLDQKTSDLVSNLDSNERCDLYMLYTNQPDSTLHTTDLTDDDAVKKVIQDAERSITAFKAALGHRKYNLVIVSDHGMSPYIHKYQLSQALRERAKKYYGGSLPMWYTQTDKVEDTVKHINIYLKNNHIPGVVAKDVENLPKRFQMCGFATEGIPEIILLLDDEVAMDTYTIRSGHGYDNDYRSMFGQLRLSGPSFTNLSLSDNTVESLVLRDGDVVVNTELYNLFCALLGIKPANNTGKLDTFDSYLVTPPNRSSWKDDYFQVSAPCDNLTNVAASRTILVSLLVNCLVIRESLIKFIIG